MIVSTVKNGITCLRKENECRRTARFRIPVLSYVNLFKNRYINLYVNSGQDSKGHIIVTTF